MLVENLILFISAFSIFVLTGPKIVEYLAQIGRYFRWQEFTLAFVLIALAGSIPNLLLGVTSALHGKPQLSLGDIIGGNIVDLTLVIALAVFIGGSLPAKGSILRDSALITALIAILPALLMLDGTISRWDGLFSIAIFLSYIWWLFSKEKKLNFKKEKEEVSFQDFVSLLKSFGKLVLALVVLLVSVNFVVESVVNIAKELNIPVYLIGIFGIALGNALPEGYMAIVSAKRGKKDLILGDLMGSVIIPSTLGLGIVSLIHPIVLEDYSSFLIARIVLLVSTLLFFVFMMTSREIDKKEAIVLLGLYLTFVILEILNQIW